MKKIKRAYDIVIITENLLKFNSIGVSVRWVECMTPPLSAYSGETSSKHPTYHFPKSRIFSFIIHKDVVYECSGPMLRSALMFYMDPLLTSDIPELVHEVRKFIEKAVYDHEADEPLPAHDNASDTLSSKSFELPGIRDKAVHPIIGISLPLRDIIMNLNDFHKWSREQIADWLDEISDPTGESGPDIRFKLKENHE